jgi:exonuclease III
MAHIIKIMTLNINAIHSDNKIRILEELLNRQGIDIGLLQETATDKLHTIRGYTTYSNDGTNKRGTSILIKEGIHVKDVKRIPTGRGMAIECNGMWILNIYAPSGAEKRQERDFFSTDLTHLLPSTDTDMILAGDFNCIIDKTETTGSGSYSRALKIWVRGLGLSDGWNSLTTQGGYTHFTARSATILDRIYLTERLATRKTGIETLPAAFTDHMAVIIRIAINTSTDARERKMENEHETYEQHYM